MNKMTQEEVKKVKELIDADSDIKKSKDYYYRIFNGDYSCIEDALMFANNKFEELSLTDAEIVILSGIKKNTIIDNRNLVDRALGNLNSVHELLIAKICKNIFTKN